MGIKDLKHRKAFSSTLRNDLSELFDQLSIETSINKTKLLDKAIELLLKEYNVDVVVDYRVKNK